ncbi:MAG: NADH-quinone oxidoreductase subunit G [Candidatus Nanopelagicales bacterium]
MTLTSENKSVKNEELITATIDGIQVQVPKGTLIIRAAERMGTFVPRFCDHPSLAPVAACRMCLVEIEGMPKPQPSCAVPLTEGMVVKTQMTSKVAEDAQAGVMEFLLINHPLDCPVCDKGGECPLQNQAMTAGRAESRFEIEKRTFPKPLELSTEILLDRERCVECARCTRFSEEIAGDPFIELLERGAKQQVGIATGEPFNSYFSGNTVQICPVGALTSSAYRFRSRPFDLVSVPTTCEHCASGCSLRTDYRRETVMRRLAWEDPAVNEDWNCDKGRFAFAYLKQNRLTQPKVKNSEGKQLDALWPDAIDFAVKGLKAAEGKVAVLLGGRLTMEDAYAYSKFARLALETNDIDFRNRVNSDEELAFLSSVVAGSAGSVTYQELEKAKNVILVSFEPEEESPIVFLRLRKAAEKSNISITAIAPYLTRGLEKIDAEVVLTKPGDEAKVLKGLEIAKDSIIIVGERAAAINGLLSAVVEVAEKSNSKIAWIPRRAGERGSVEVGVLPNLLPGGRPVTETSARSEVGAVWGVNASQIPSKPGRTHQDILNSAINGEIKALIIAGLDVTDAPDPQLFSKALNAVDFVVTLGIHENSLTRYANVSLPVAPVTEKSGTFINWEGRPRPFGRAITSTNSITDARVLAMLAEGLGFDFGLQTIDELRQELASFGTWNGPKEKAPNVKSEESKSVAKPNVILSTWNLLLDDGALQQGEEHLAGTQRPAVAHLSHKTAQENGLASDDKVIISNSNGSITLKLEVIEMVNDVIWIPSNSNDSKVKFKLAAKDGDLVSIQKGSF